MLLLSERVHECLVVAVTSSRTLHKSQEMYNSLQCLASHSLTPHRPSPRSHFIPQFILSTHGDSDESEHGPMRSSRSLATYPDSLTSLGTQATATLQWHYLPYNEYLHITHSISSTLNGSIHWRQGWFGIVEYLVQCHINLLLHLWVLRTVSTLKETTNPHLKLMSAMMMEERSRKLQWSSADDTLKVLLTQQDKIQGSNRCN